MRATDARLVLPPSNLIVSLATPGTSVGVVGGHNQLTVLVTLKAVFGDVGPG
jgi:hypothetical protein